MSRSADGRSWTLTARRAAASPPCLSLTLVTRDGALAGGLSAVTAAVAGDGPTDTVELAAR